MKSTHQLDAGGALGGRGTADTARTLVAWAGIRRRLWLVVLPLLVVVPTTSSAEPPGENKPRATARASFDKLAAWVKKNGGSLGAVVVDLSASERWVAIEPTRALNPASNQKLLTAAVALEQLGPSFRYRTSLYGTLEANTVKQLAIVGHGDPSLDVEDLWRLARALESQGVRRVEGGIRVDQSRFDENFEPPAYDQQPEEWASFRAPVSAVSVNQNTVTLNVLATSADEQARVWFDPPGIVSQSGSIETKPKGSGQAVTWGSSSSPVGVSAVLGGHVSEGQPRVRFVRRVGDPRVLPGKVLSALLAQMGVKVAGEVRSEAQQGGDRLAYLTSDPLSVLLTQLGKHSDNFYAETIFKSLAALDPKRPATSERAQKRVLDWLREAGLADKHTKVTNGSGLFDANRLTADVLARLLVKVYKDAKLAPDFLAQLAIGGQDGTLRSRFRQKSLRGRIRAKTGTLRNVDALAGYAFSSNSPLPRVFVVMVNGIEGRHGEVRREIDRAVSALVTSD